MTAVWLRHRKPKPARASLGGGPRCLEAVQRWRFFMFETSTDLQGRWMDGCGRWMVLSKRRLARRRHVERRGNQSNLHRRARYYTRRMPTVAFSITLYGAGSHICISTCFSCSGRSLTQASLPKSIAGLGRAEVEQQPDGDDGGDDDGLWQNVALGSGGGRTESSRPSVMARRTWVYSYHDGGPLVSS